MLKRLIPVTFLVASLTGCGSEGESEAPMSDFEAKLAQYQTVRLTTDLSQLSEAEKAMIPLLVEAADAMTDVFWLESYGDPVEFLASLDGSAARAYGTINFGPWDRIDGNAPWLPGAGPKPAGARFYPADMTTEEFEAAVEAAPDGGDALRSLYTVVRRDEEGSLVADADLALARACKVASDPAGHYSRPDLFRLEVDGREIYPGDRG